MVGVNWSVPAEAVSLDWSQEADQHATFGGKVSSSSLAV